MTPMATKISYSSAGRKPRYGVVAAPKPRTYATLAQPATQPLNPLYRAMQSSPQPRPTMSTFQLGMPDQPRIDVGDGTLIGAPRVAAPVAAPTQPQPLREPSAGGTAGGPSGSTFDMSGDPILAQIKALGDKSVADAETGAAGLKKQAFIRSGFGDLAQTLLGDTNTARAATENPLSTLAQLMQSDRQRRNQIDVDTNARNTFYGSERANLLGDAAKQNLFEQAQAQSALYDLLSQIDQSVLSAKNRAQDEYIGALPGAYDRAKAAGAPAPADVGGGIASAGGAGDGAPNVIPNAFEDNGANQLLALMLAARKPKQPIGLY